MRQVAMETLAPNIYEPSARKFLHVTILAPRILGWILDFWKFSAPPT